MGEPNIIHLDKEIRKNAGSLKSLHATIKLVDGRLEDIRSDIQEAFANTSAVHDQHHEETMAVLMEGAKALHITKRRAGMLIVLAFVIGLTLFGIWATIYDKIH